MPQDTSGDPGPRSGAIPGPDRTFEPQEGSDPASNEQHDGAFTHELAEAMRREKAKEEGARPDDPGPPAGG